ncbi:MAG: MFS transporter [Isosphaeraceae bacterium]
MPVNDGLVPRDSQQGGKAALRFVVLLGIVSLFADMTYEGARSITGPFLALLGASGTVVGLVAGFGELVGYGLRLVSGYVADRSRRYWTVTLTGYGLSILAVPLLALAGRWEVAAALMICERMGKATRTPARDAMLSHATHLVGHGWGFGLHEALDQAGAVVGPLAVAGVVAAFGGYRTAFAMLLIPAAITLAVLLAARSIYPRPHDLEPITPAHDGRGFSTVFWLYLAAAALVAAGYADFPLIAYHLCKLAVVPSSWIPLYYAVAMGVDALAALLFGHFFDRFGLATLGVAVVLSASFAPLVFLGGPSQALVGMILWGIGMGAQESILRAAIAAMIPGDRRATAYGLFNTGFGLSWFAGSALMGFLYDTSLTALIGFSVAIQLLALPLLWRVARTTFPDTGIERPSPSTPPDDP